MATLLLTPSLATIGDPEGTRTVTSIVALLAALGLALLLLAVWIFRTTRPDPELLAPLEVMGERSWRRGDPVWQRRRLDELRPDGANPLAPSVAPPEIDASFDDGPTATGFDDLAGATAEPDPEEATTDDDAAGVVEESAADDDVVVDRTEVETERPPIDATPAGVAGPDLDGFGDDEFDPEALAAAQAELERELAESAGSSPNRQLDLFERDGED